MTWNRSRTTTISSIEMGKSMMGHQITFFASGNKVRMKWIDKKHGFTAAVRNRMKGGSGSGGGNGEAATAPEPDVADQLRKLAQLRDDGILTDDEFQARKTQLLGL